jgi:glycosyltransferase involved in cell wall biosynthesis
MNSQNNTLPLQVSQQQPAVEHRPLILYIITRAARGGAQMHLLNLAVAMKESFDVHLAVGEEGFLTEACREKGIVVHILCHMRRSSAVTMDLKAFSQTRRLLKLLRPDLIHVHTFKAGFIGRLAAWTLGIPALYTIHAWLWGTLAVSRFASRVAIPLERFGALCCERIITVSYAGERKVREHHIADETKVVTIHNGICDWPTQAPVRANQTPVIIMVARFTPGKDFALLLRAFQPLANRAYLWLVGDGETREAMEALAVRLGIASSVSFLAERHDVPELLAQADVFVLASETEMLPISILEAMRAALPVVASDVGGVSEEVEHGATGLLVPKGEVGALTNALQLLIGDPELRNRLGRSGRRLFETRFRDSIMTSSTYQLYLSVLRERAGAINPIITPHIAESRRG